MEPTQISRWLREEALGYHDPRNVAWANDAAAQIDTMALTISTLTGHLLNAAVCLHSGGSRAEAMRICDDGAAIGSKYRLGTSA